MIRYKGRAKTRLLERSIKTTREKMIIMATATKLCKDIEELERQTQKLRDQLEYRNKLAKNERVALELHEANCLHGFGRDCAFYEAKDFTVGEKKRWLDKADTALTLVDADMVLKLNEIIKGR